MTPPPLRLKCVDCGKAFTWERRPGRRPVRCEKHREPSRVGARGRPEDKARDHAKRRAKAEERARAANRVDSPDDAIRLAISLSIHPDDPKAAAAYAGVVDDPALLERALRLYKDLSDAGDLAAALRMLRAAAVQCAHFALAKASEMSGAQAATAAQALARAYDVLRGDGAQTQTYSSITFVLPEGYGVKPSAPMAN